MSNEVVNAEAKVKKEELKTYLFHPISVIALFILDWGGFILEVPSVLNPIFLCGMAAVIFTVAYFLIYNLQQHFAGEDHKTARMKAIIGALIAAVPAPVMTTFVGSIILGLSGIDALKEKGISGIMDIFKKRPN